MFKSCNKYIFQYVCELWFHSYTAINLRSHTRKGDENENLLDGHWNKKVFWRMSWIWSKSNQVLNTFMTIYHSKSDLA